MGRAPTLLCDPLSDTRRPGSGGRDVRGLSWSDLGDQFPERDVTNLRWSPTAYGVFGLVLDGKVLSYHHQLEKDLLPLLVGQRNIRRETCARHPRERPFGQPSVGPGSRKGPPPVMGDETRPALVVWPLPSNNQKVSEAGFCNHGSVMRGLFTESDHRSSTTALTTRVQGTGTMILQGEIHRRLDQLEHAI